MTEDANDPGKLLFSTEIKDCSRKDYVRMGRSIQFRNSKKLFIYAIAAAIVLVGVSVTISYLILAIGLIVLLQVAVFFEYSSRNIATRIEERTPIHYYFYEDGLCEIINGENKYIAYGSILHIKKSDFLYTIVCPRDIFVISRGGLDENSETLMTRLCQQLSARPKTHSRSKR
ncbi:MAG: hypothetical protein MJZ38_01395 [archaeon]|nr:hypothetical protein [archaeon]